MLSNSILIYNLVEASHHYSRWLTTEARWLHQSYFRKKWSKHVIRYPYLFLKPFHLFKLKDVLITKFMISHWSKMLYSDIYCCQLDHLSKRYVIRISESMRDRLDMVLKLILQLRQNNWLICHEIIDFV